MFCAAQAPCGRAVKQEQGKGEAWPLDEVQAGARGYFSIFDFPVASSSSTDSLASKFSFLLLYF